MPSRAPLCLLACEPAADLAAAVGKHLGVAVTESHDVWFTSGEGKHVIEANVRGTDAYVFQRPIVPGSAHSVYDRLVMLLHAVDAARLADVDRLTVVFPYLPGSRQDKRKGHTREGVSTGLFGRLLESAGVDMVLTVEPHNEATVGCYAPRNTVFEGVTIDPSFSAFLSEGGFVHDKIASTDVGGLELARRFAHKLERELVALSKERDYSKPHTVTRTTLIGEVAGRGVTIIDDMVDTGGSVVSAVETLWEQGATDITVATAHPLLSGPAWDRMAALSAQATSRGVRFALVGTSSVVHPDAPDYYHSFALEPLLARVIRSVNSRRSVRALEE